MTPFQAVFVGATFRVAVASPDGATLFRKLNGAYAQPVDDAGADFTRASFRNGRSHERVTCGPMMFLSDEPVTVVL